MDPRRALAAALGLLPLLAAAAFAASVAYLPHADTASALPEGSVALERLGRAYVELATGARDDYEHTVHVDENVHWVGMAATQRAEGLRHDEIFFGSPPGQPLLSLNQLVHERGFHTSLVMFESMTGIPWNVVIRFLPALWLGFTALLVGLALRPSPAAPFAAAFVALVPTTARFLGPGFLVPIGFGLAWIAAAMLLLREVHERNRGAGALFLVLVWAFFIHLVAGLAVLLLVACSIPFARGNRKAFARLAAMAALPVLAMANWFARDVESQARVLGFLPNDLTVFDHLGLPVLLLWVVACALVVLRPPQHGRVVVQAATLASIVVLGIITANLVGELRLYVLYDRWHQVFAVLAAVPAAHGVVVLAEAAVVAAAAAAREVRRRMARGARGHGRPAGAAHAAAVGVVALVLFGAVTDDGVNTHLEEPYYHVLEDSDWAAFLWVQQNVNDTYEVFIAHPWKAVILSAMTGRVPHTYLEPGNPPIRGADWDAYLGGTRADGVWLVSRDISFAVDANPPLAPEFEDTGPLTSQLAWPYALQLREVRGS